MAKVIMIQGTMSGAGKSLLVAGLCRIFKQDGYVAAPFKSQNMALNSFITSEGLEMGRAQVMQAECAGIDPMVCMNPILLKPTSDVGSQVIVNGEVIGNMSAREYFAYKKKLVPDIKKAFKKLSDIADIIVIEGAGSPAEINLKANDIVNMGMAEMVDAPVLLVGDIDRGGVFAQLYGTTMLLENEERERIKGFVINKFRGDVTLLDSGIEMITDVYERVFKILDDSVVVEKYVKDGDEVKKGQLMAKVRGDVRVLLSGERVALNYLQRMSGIATYTHEVAALLEGSKTVLLDTRKTTPNMRIFEKYAVRCGGGQNHRYNLSDGILLKDNHIGAAGSVTKAIQMAKEYAPFVRKIEIETETLDQVKEAVEAGADIIMLDNMDPATMKEAVKIIDGRAKTECSGNVTRENIVNIIDSGVDYVSSGAITYSAPILDISMKNLHVI